MDRKRAFFAPEIPNSDSTYFRCNGSVTIIRQRIAGPLGGREAVSTSTVGVFEKIVILLVSATCHFLFPGPVVAHLGVPVFFFSETPREGVSVCLKGVFLLILLFILQIRGRLEQLLDNLKTMQSAVVHRELAQQASDMIIKISTTYTRSYRT